MSDQSRSSFFENYREVLKQQEPKTEGAHWRRNFFVRSYSVYASAPLIREDHIVETSHADGQVGRESEGAAVVKGRRCGGGFGGEVTL